jgi:glycosyltransferase involved in cell wall biosynthesis
MSSLSAIVPATNSPATLERCIAAIRRSAAPPDEVIVTSEPATAGPAAARNAGAERASGDVLVFVDADVEVHADAFRRIREAFDADPKLAAVFGSYDDNPPADGAVSAFRNLLHHHVHSSSAGPAETFWAGLGAVRRDAFVATGGFDAERYPHASIEDVELGLRLSGAGARIELDPEIQGKHLKRWTLVDMVRTDFARRGLPWAELVLAGEGGSTALNLGWRHRLSAAAAVGALVALVLGRARLALAAVAALLGLNRDFYALLWRRLGPWGGVQGVGLHALHHLVSVAALVRAATAGVRTGSDGTGSIPGPPSRKPRD